jgi:Domain of unknown function (DUF4112)
MKPEVQEVEAEVLPPAQDANNEFSRLLAYILDDLIPIPGTSYRIGLDPIIGLIPGFGDTSATAVGSLILVRGLQARVPRVVLVRMATNMLINALLGGVPGIGDLFSAWFKSNRRNYQLLEKHAGSGRASTTGDWAFLIAILAVILAVAVTTTLAVGYLAYRMLTLIFG